MRIIKHTALFAALLAFCQISGAELKKNPLPDWALGGFVRPEGVNPVIAPNKESVFDCPMQKRPIKWEESDTFNPAAAVYKNKICVLYRAEDNTAQGIGSRTSRLGLAETEDGVRMKRYPSPVMFPAEDANKEFEWTGGCEDPRIAQTEDGRFVMTYTSWNKKTARLCIATSKDLRIWQKHGPAFKNASGGKYINMPCKSAAIVCEQSKKDTSKFAISKVGGKYFMYWGEACVFAATSDDLINWQPVENPNGSLKALIAPRAGYFDSSLTEVGPAAIKTKNGILVLYNGKNARGKNADRRFAEGTYAAGQVLFDLDDPLKPIARLDVPFFRPMADFERRGQYAQGTVFIEGLVFYKGRWFMYYGCADSLVGVAVCDPQKTEKFGDPIPEYSGVSLNENGEFFWDFAQIEPAALNAKIAKFAKENPGKPLEVSAGGKVPAKAAQTLINIALKNKIQNIDFVK
ncbi:MAG: hypothetical protein IKS15_01665 [Opitutales bacterium]|nr:hypothetical protein [Opitutales bacterium]